MLSRVIIVDVVCRNSFIHIIYVAIVGDAVEEVMMLVRDMRTDGLLT